MPQKRITREPFDWNWFRTSWKRRLIDFGLDPCNLLTKKPIAAIPYCADRPIAVWWEREHVDKNLVTLNHTILHGRVNDRSFYRQFQPLEGAINTLHLLTAVDGDIDATCALLTMASLHPRYGSSRRDKRSTLFEFYDDILDLRRKCRDVLAERNLRTPWIGWHSDVLPGPTSDDDDYILTSMDAVARYLAEEHAATFCQFAAVVLKPTKSLPDELLKAVQAYQDRIRAEARREASIRQEADRRFEEYSRRREEERAQHAAARAERLQRVNERRRLAGYSPISGFDDWSRISIEELTHLLWSMPVIYIADQYEVSDVAVHKAAKRWDIHKPPAGFWKKVHAGTIPHPGGKPQKTKQRP